MSTARQQVSWGVFCCAMAVYLATANGHLVGPDQEHFYRMARSVVFDRSFAIEPISEGLLVTPRGIDGRNYAVYAPGLPLALAPLVLLGQLWSEPGWMLRWSYEWFSRGDQDRAARFLVSYFNAPVTAATAALLTLFVTRQ